jgi:RNA polymerase sigma-70 factor (ECF subfamily)
MKRDMLGEIVEIPLVTKRLVPGESSTSREASLAFLIERAASGDATAFEQLMIHSQHRVIALTWRILGNEEDARDAAQEVFLRVYKYLGRFKPEQDFFGWLYRIAVNVCRDMERKRRLGQHRLTSLDAEGEHAHLTSSDNQEEDAYLAQRRLMISSAMGALPEKERMSLVLRDFEGLSTEEVASIMNTRPATVRVQISSARAKIKRYCDRLLKRGQKEEGHGLH